MDVRTRTSANDARSRSGHALFTLLAALLLGVCVSARSDESAEDVRTKAILYRKSMAGLERRRSMINLQFMLEMRELEEFDEAYFEEELNRWLSDEPLTNDEIFQLMRQVERQRKLEGKPPLVQFLTSRKGSKQTEK